jgi:hypothetical protein
MPTLAGRHEEGFSLRFEAFLMPITFLPTFGIYDNIQAYPRVAACAATLVYPMKALRASADLN